MSCIVTSVVADIVRGLRTRHDATLRELHLLLNVTPSVPFPDVSVDVYRSDQPSGYAEWKDKYALGGDTSIANVLLPTAPPPSPPAGVVIFPDEPAAQHIPVQLPSETSAPPPATISGNAEAGPSSPRKSPPPQTVNPADILPRQIPPPSTYEVDDWITLDNYNPAAEPSHDPLSLGMPLSSAYTATLPPIPAQPTVSAKRQKRYKDDKIGVTKLYAQFVNNPLSDALRSGSKCVLTNDWRLAMRELRHMRAMERIEAKKADGRWSLRQPKKAKGPAIPKSHWDYLLEEMVSPVVSSRF